jgi:hypothetical protein
MYFSTSFEQYASWKPTLTGGKTNICKANDAAGDQRWKDSTRVLCQKKRSHCNFTVLTKQFFCNSSRVLHHPAGLGECDFGDCFNEAAHPPTSIALQCWGIPKTAIQVLSTTIQTMQYVLKTGFGESSDSYGRTSIAPNSGLGQGSGALPPGFLALSSLIVNAYRRTGHGAKVLSLYTRQLFHLTAVMYVDDTNLLHWPGASDIDCDKLIEAIQHATTDYGRLTIASGGDSETDQVLGLYF